MPPRGILCGLPGADWLGRVTWEEFVAATKQRCMETMLFFSQKAAVKKIAREEGEAAIAATKAEETSQAGDTQQGNGATEVAKEEGNAATPAAFQALGSGGLGLRRD